MSTIENTIQKEDTRKNLCLLALGALGIVYGDIGTSPLYAFRECFAGTHGVGATSGNILGILSLIFWSLILIISVKYLMFLMRADNKGEGGILALMALIQRDKNHSPKWNIILTILGIFGAALIYGDGIITPSISVLSAVEGLNVATTKFQPYIIYISMAILTVLFLFQRKGSAKIGSVFGPILLVWFIVIGLLGLFAIFKNPGVIWAINPVYAVNIFIDNQYQGFAVLGTVLLAITGGEVLYADMGHFGKQPIRFGWFTIVLPCLLLNYFGQGAYLLGNPLMSENLFYRIVPVPLIYPLVALATIATIIASQAVISGAFSLTRQAIQLGFSPRLHIIHTSSMEIGQVYMPSINMALFIGTSLLILVFKSSGNLAGAYGVAVSGTMLITTILALFIARKIWPVPLVVLIPVATFFILANIAFFLSCLIKIRYGGWIPVFIAAVVYILMIIWKRNRETLRVKMESQSLPVGIFIKDIEVSKPLRVSGTAVFLSGNSTGIPRTLLHNFKHNKVLHDTIVLLSVRNEDVPFIPEDRRAEDTELGCGLYRIILRYGFSENPDIPKALENIRHAKINFDPMKTTFFLGRETLIINPGKPFANIQRKIFSFMSKNSFDASKFYRIPPGRVIELGLQIEI
ncbi:MAG TPA: potassium transporter Kup [Lentisphaeria bacterium]|nr:MAG: potassium transporter Kup [Lentisphaerae bacterium GWF2_49_21]HBC89152.1 potassium transporter Kup [Lentisphaeria bacterium]